MSSSWGMICLPAAVSLPRKVRVTLERQNVQPVLHVFYPQRVQKAAHRIFRGGVSRSRRQGGIAGNGNDASYSPPGFQQGGQGIFRTIDSTPEVHVHKAPEHIQVHIPEHCPHRKAGVVDQDVYPSEMLQSLLHQISALLLNGHVGRYAKHLGSAFLPYPCSDFLKERGPAGCQHESGSEPAE